MFPTDVNFNNVDIATTDETVDTASTDTLGRSLKFDYDTQSFVFVDGKNVEPSKVDSIKQWIELYIRTEVKKYAVYTDDFGVDLRDLVGYRLPRGYQISEIMRRINEGILTKCPNVVSVSEWSFDKGAFSFKVTTNTGEEVLISE